MTKYVNMIEINLENSLKWLRRFVREHEDVSFAELYIAEDGTPIIQVSMTSITWVQTKHDDASDSWTKTKTDYMYKVHGRAKKIIEFYDVVKERRRDGTFTNQETELSRSSLLVNLSRLKERGGVKREAERLRYAFKVQYQADGGGDVLSKQRLIPFKPEKNFTKVEQR